VKDGETLPSQTFALIPSSWSSSSAIQPL